jgi:hypothetical protein
MESLTSLHNYENSLGQWLDDVANNDLINSLVANLVAVFDAFTDIQKPQDTVIIILDTFSQKIEEMHLTNKTRDALKIVFLSMLREAAATKARECLVGEEALRQLEDTALQEYLAATKN